MHTKKGGISNGMIDDLLVSSINEIYKVTLSLGLNKFLNAPWSSDFVYLNFNFIMIISHLILCIGNTICYNRDPLYLMTLHVHFTWLECFKHTLVYNDMSNESTHHFLHVGEKDIQVFFKLMNVNN